MVLYILADEKKKISVSHKFCIIIVVAFQLSSMVQSSMMKSKFIEARMDIFYFRFIYATVVFMTSKFVLYCLTMSARSIQLNLLHPLFDNS